MQALMHAHEGVRMASTFKKNQELEARHCQTRDGQKAAVELNELQSQVQQNTQSIEALQSQVRSALEAFESDLASLSKGPATDIASSSADEEQAAYDATAAAASHLQALFNEVPEIVATMQSALTTVSGWCQPSPQPRKASLVPDPSKESA